MNITLFAAFFAFAVIFAWLTVKDLVFREKPAEAGICLLFSMSSLYIAGQII